MAGSTVNIKCPFYHKHTSWTISCEGLMTEASSSTTYFVSEAAKRLYMDLHCNTVDGAGCPLYRAIMQKYDE